MKKLLNSRVLAALMLCGGVTGVAAGFGRAHRFFRSPGSEDRLRRILAPGDPLDSSGVIFQKGPFDCGPAAMRMALRLLGIPVDQEELARDLMDRPEGTSMLRLRQAARRHGLPAEARLVLPWALRTIPVPSIALMSGSHWVVVERVDDQGVVIADPARGRYRTTVFSFFLRSRGELLLLRATPRGASPNGVSGRAAPCGRAVHSLPVST